jgi:uncharacterized protein
MKSANHCYRSRLTFLSFLLLIVLLAFTAALLHRHSTSVKAEAPLTETLCGNGSAPDYGFTYDLRQAHWTVGWQNYTSERAVNEVDVILDKLNADTIAQTMILILPREKVGNRVNCAVHFLRYMQLGQPSGERRDNGFVFLIVVEPGKIDVHYGVGLGLPALTAQELTDLNRKAEEAYQSSENLDDALLTLIREFDTVARDNYSPLIAVSPTPQAITLSTENLSFQDLLCLICVGIILFLIFLWFLRQLARGAITFGPPRSGGSGSWGGGMGGPFGGGSGGSSWGGGGSSPSRGGSGSGRSGRGN